VVDSAQTDFGQINLKLKVIWILRQ